MDAQTCMLTRRSIRSYTDEPISDALRETLLRAAFAAPSACNRQPRDFVVIEDRPTLDALAKLFSLQPMLRHAAMAVVVCGDTLKMPIHDMLLCDCAAATENLLLSAHAAGLGAVWGGVFRKAQIEGTQKLLGLPAHVVPMAVVSLGHPAEEKEPNSNFSEKHVHRRKW